MVARSWAQSAPIAFLRFIRWVGNDKFIKPLTVASALWLAVFINHKESMLRPARHTHLFKLGKRHIHINMIVVNVSQIQVILFKK